MDIPDFHDAESVKNHAEKIKGRTLRPLLPAGAVEETSGNKGKFGQTVERVWFGLKNNSDSRPDFEEAGVELKAFPLKQLKNGKKVAKERLVLNIIDYVGVGHETWDESTFLRKNALILLIGYLFKGDQSYLDYVVELVRMLSLHDLPEEDLKIIRDDWEKILTKVREGKAHELSESDTLYLSACTKGPTAEASYRPQFVQGAPKAKQRAFSFKQRFLNALIMKDLQDAERVVKELDEYKPEMSFEELVVERFKPFFGMTFEEISKKVGHRGSDKAKARYATVTRAILGVKKKKILEFEKAEIIAKTIRLAANGSPKESISFPAFKSAELVNERWEESELRDTLTKRFFFVIYQESEKGLIFRDVRFWGMPEEELENEVRPVWEKTVEQIRSGHADELPKISENRIVHVRPHGRRSTDFDITPTGQKITKQCFWLNASYIKEQI